MLTSPALLHPSFSWALVLQISGIEEEGQESLCQCRRRRKSLWRGEEVGFVGCQDHSAADVKAFFAEVTCLALSVRYTSENN